MANEATATPDQNPGIVGAEVYVLSFMWCDRNDGTPMMTEPSVHTSLDGDKGARTTMKKDIKQYLIDHDGFTDKFEDLEAYIDGNLEDELEAQSELSITVDGEGTNCTWSINVVKIQ